MTGQLSFAYSSAAPELSAAELVAELSRPCVGCSLGSFYPKNPGLIWSGSLDARIAILSDYPAPYEMHTKAPLWMVQTEWERWLQRLDLKAGDVLVTCISQCAQPPGRFSETSEFFRVFQAETKHCMHQRALRLLGAMPQLEVAVTLGLPVAKILLGGDPTYKSHIGEWFGSDHLPGVGVFCMEHPRLIEPGINEKRGRHYEILSAFQNLYLRQGPMAATIRACSAARRAGDVLNLNYES